MVPKLFQEGFLPYNFCWIQKTYFSTQVPKCQVSSFALGLTKFVLKNCVKMWENCKKVKPPPLSFMYVIIEKPVLKLPIFKSCFLFTHQRFAGLVKSQGKWSFLKNYFQHLRSFIHLDILPAGTTAIFSILIALPLHVQAFFKCTCIAFTLN